MRPPPAVTANYQGSFTGASLRQITDAHCGRLEHNDNCETCALIRLCRKFIASYEAKVDDLRRETLRSEELALERNELRDLLREAQATIEVVALLIPKTRA